MSSLPHELPGQVDFNLIRKHWENRFQRHATSASGAVSGAEGNFV